MFRGRERGTIEVFDCTYLSFVAVALPYMLLFLTVFLSI